MHIAKLLGPETTPDGGLADVNVTGITADSRAVRPGFLFAALAGTKTDGARFVADAVAQGAVVVLAGAGAPIAVPLGVLVLRASEPRRALALMATRFYGPGPETIVAITGTNGKTSVAEFTRQIFAACGRQAASLGTIGIVKPDGGVYGSLTTPDPVTLAQTLAELRAEGITHLSLEASSHGLDQFRLDGVHLKAAAFNNLGRDHLDYHPTMEAYLEAKLGLFKRLMQPGQTVVVNEHSAADEIAEKARRAATANDLRLVTVGPWQTTFELTHIHRGGNGMDLSIVHRRKKYQKHLNLVGAYQASNALVAAALAISCDEDPERVLNALERLTGVKGRLETVGQVRGGLAIVDYAHKPEALAAALSEIRKFMFSSGKLICVFGCGGDRDKGKRPIMGRIARELADVVIVTDDNPRSEVPNAIRAEILAGTNTPSADATKAIEAYIGDKRRPLGEMRPPIGDRAAAIREGVRLLGQGDVLLVAGKGHETGQIVGDKVLPFSDQEEILAAILEAGHG